MCSRFISEMFSAATPLRELGSRTGQGKKLQCSTVETETSDDPQGVLELAWPLGVIPSFGKGVGLLYPHIN